MSATSDIPDTATVTTVAGLNRFQTAVAVAITADGKTKASDVTACEYTIANGHSFADGLAGSAFGVPILLTHQDAIQADTKAFLDVLVGTATVPGKCAGGLTLNVVGGPAVVSSTQLEMLDAYGSALRYGGADRYATARAVAKANWSSTVVLATGLNYADALAAGSLGHPILLNDGPSVSADNLAFLNKSGSVVTTVKIVGGESVVPKSVENELSLGWGKDVSRLAGADRAATAVKIAGAAEAAVTLVLGYGDDGFADALGSFIFGNDILLTMTDSLPAATSAFLVKNCDTIDNITVVGGPAAVSAATAAAAKAAATCDTTQAKITSAKLTNSDFKQASVVIQPANGNAALSAKAVASSAADGAVANAWDIVFTPDANSAVKVNIFDSKATCDAANLAAAGSCSLGSLPYFEVIAPTFTGLSFANLNTAWTAAGANTLVALVWDSTALASTLKLGSQPATKTLAGGSQDTTVVVTFDKPLSGYPATAGLFKNFVDGVAITDFEGQPAVAVPACPAAPTGCTTATYKWNDVDSSTPTANGYINIRFATDAITPLVGGKNSAPLMVILS